MPSQLQLALAGHFNKLMVAQMEETDFHRVGVTMVALVINHRVAEVLIPLMVEVVHPLGVQVVMEVVHPLEVRVVMEVIYPLEVQAEIEEISLSEA